jgi:hypothetical protein
VFSTLLDYLSSLSKQTYQPGAIAYTYFFTFRTWVAYLTQKKWHVPETRRTEHPEESSKWDGSYHFPPCTYNGVPIKDGASGKKKKNKFIQMNPVLREQLHPQAKKLLDRLINEMTNYGVMPTKDRLLAMSCNPLMATLGMEELDLLSYYIQDNESYKALIASVKMDHHKTCMEVLEHQIKSDCAHIIPNNDDNRASKAVMLLGMMMMQKKKRLKSSRN